MKFTIFIVDDPLAEDMFAPDPDEDELSPFSKQGGMFSGGGSLFDDSDDVSSSYLNSVLYFVCML